MHKLLKMIPITPDMVSLWVPSGQNRAQDLIRGNHGQCYGTHPNVPVISVPYSLNACDTLACWTASEGASLSIDTEDKKEGTGSLKNTVALPAGGGKPYNAYYNLAGTWDWSDKKYILFWLYCNRASTEFNYVRIQIRDTSGKYRYWDLTFSAGEWTAFKLLLSSPDAHDSPDITSIDKLYFNFGSADTVPFHFKVDDLRIAYRPSLINPSVGWHFDGLNDYIDCGNDASLALTRWTMGAWIYRKVDSGLLERLMSKSDVLTWDYWCHIITTSEFGAAFVDTIGGTHAINTIEKIPLFEWTFVTTTFDGTYIKLFINSDFKKTSADFSAFTPKTSDCHLWIGRMRDDYNFNGYEAFPFVANKTWSIAQVKNFYLATKGMFAPRG